MANRVSPRRSAAGAPDPLSGDLFGSSLPPQPAATSPTSGPLAERLRPKCLAEVVGQEEALGQDGPIGHMLARGRLASIILWGPPGCGKTTIARLLAKQVAAPLIALSAVMSGIADLRNAFEDARRLRANGKSAILFIDEIHRFNRAQQDGLLHEVEDGTVTLIGATTENPSFNLNSALLSRCQVVVLQRLSEPALQDLLVRAERAQGHGLPLLPEARGRLVELADGDGRYLLNMVESLADQPPEPLVGVEELGHLLQRRLPIYDKAEDGHYNLISALHKSVRGSDPDAALYWLCRMLVAGEDPRYVARRVIRMASEDIGLADPQALALTLAAADTYERLGSPEGELAIAEAVIYLAVAPKSNAAYLAYKEATAAAKEHGSLTPPMHILNAPTRMMRDMGYGKGYAYDHDAPERFSGQSYFPDEMARLNFYRPSDQGREVRFAERLAMLDDLRAQRNAEGGR